MPYKEIEKGILQNLLLHGKLSWSQVRDLLIPQVWRVGVESLGVKVARYLKKLVESGLIEKENRQYVLTNRGHYEAYKIKVKNEVDELNMNQIMAFEMLLSWYKNRAVIRASENAKPVEYLRIFLDIISQVDEKQLESMILSLEDIAMWDETLDKQV